MNGYTGRKFKVGDVVKLINDVDLYTYENLHGLERLELNKDYTVYSVEDNGKFIRLIKDSGEIEGVFSHRLVHATPVIAAESLRDSILFLQQERVSLQEKIEQNIAQEKGLTEQLKGLGFLLVESEERPANVVDEKSVLYAEDIEEDMTDPRNWKVGDVITGESGYSFDGKPVKIRKILYEGESFECTKEFDLSDDFQYRFPANECEFLYRPVVN